jgi:hypothetical protein
MTSHSYDMTPKTQTLAINFIKICPDFMPNPVLLTCFAMSSEEVTIFLLVYVLFLQSQTYLGFKEDEIPYFLVYVYNCNFLYDIMLRGVMESLLKITFFPFDYTW